MSEGQSGKSPFNKKPAMKEGQPEICEEPDSNPRAKEEDRNQLTVKADPGSTVVVREKKSSGQKPSDRTTEEVEEEQDPRIDKSGVNDPTSLNQQIAELTGQMSQMVRKEDYDHFLKENQSLSEENERLKAKIAGMEREVDNLRLTYKKANFEGLKLRKANELLKQNQKSSDIVIRNLRKELQELREDAKSQDYTKRSTDEPLLRDIIAGFAGNAAATQKLKELCNKHNRASLLAPPQSEEKPSPQQKYTNLESYEKLFDDSNEGKENSAEKEDHDEDSPIRVDSKDKKVAELEEEPGIDEPTKEGKPVERFADANNFQTTENAIKASLNAAITLRKKNFVSQSTAKAFLQGGDVQDIVKELTQSPAREQASLAVTKTQLEEVTAHIETYLGSAKNSTSLKLNEHDKRKLMGKLESDKGLDSKRMVKAFLKVALEHINFLEKHIKSLTVKNSELELKLADIKAEMDYMLKSYLDKNKTTQELLNASTVVVRQMQSERKLNFSRSNRDSLFKNDQQPERRRSSMEEVVHKAEAKMKNARDNSRDSLERKNQKSRFKKRKSKNIRYNKPAEDGEGDSDEAGRQQEENIWKKVTSFFTLK